MNKNKLNYVVDILMVLFSLIVAVSGLIIFFFLPEGVRQGGYQEFMGITKKVFWGWHNWSGIILILLIVLHFIIHWNWLAINIKNLFESKD